MRNSNMLFQRFFATRGFSRHVPSTFFFIWLLLLAVVLFSIVPSTARAEEKVQVVVLPFRILEGDELGYLKDQIPELIKTQLKNEGATLVEPEKQDLAAWESSDADTDTARRIGIKLSVDYIVWGYLSQSGSAYNLNARLLRPLILEPAATFDVAIDGIGNLLSGIQELSRELVIKLFERQKIEQIIITGNKRIESDAIEQHIKTKPGDPYTTASLSNDLKAVYAMGYFEDIRIEATDGEDGKIITFRVQEKPTIRRISFKGNYAFNDDELNEALNIKSGSILNVFSIQNNIGRIESLYKEKNYHNVKVTYEIKELENNQGDLQFIIEEGKKLKIEKISFEGNTEFDDEALKDVIKTNEKGFWTFFTDSGALKKEQLRQDTISLRNFYQNNGFIDAKVGEPQVEYLEDMIYIKFKIDEGKKYRVGKVEIFGDMLLPKAELMDRLKITQEEFYNREVVHNDVLTLTDLYSDEGYAYADVFPRIDKDTEALVVNIRYVIKQGKKVFFETISITGNKRTRDKVIRRELNVYEQELFSGKRLKRGIRNLYRLDYFDDVKVETSKGSADDKIDLNVEVKEKPTGQFQVGGGYSTLDYGYVMASIGERNLFGRGQTLNLSSTLSAKSSTYMLSFTEPYLFDTRISAGFDIYKTERDYSLYDKSSQGSRIRLGFPVVTDTRLYWSYTYDISNISNIDDDAANRIKEMDGTHITSSTQLTLRYDTRDKILNTTEGTNSFVSVEYAGIGGDIGFTKYTAGSSWFWPLFSSGTVGMINGKTGYVNENQNGFLPDYERFYLGGMNSVRGFGWRDLHALDEFGDEIGGESFIQLNLEWILPLIKDAGIMWVFFVDTGNVFGEKDTVELNDFREGGGGGIRWFSPIGPMRLEYAWILDPVENESTNGRWEFSIGTAF